MFKFLHVIKAGDFVVYPSKADRMVNVGRFKGTSQYQVNDLDDYPTRRLVEWLGHFPRDEFSQSALNEIGSFLTMFRVKRHVDPLGFQPPIVKMQCKRTTGRTPRTDVDQLLGTLGDGEYGLLVNLGSFARGVVELERNRAKLRLINGEQFVELIFEHYA